MNRIEDIKTKMEKEKVKFYNTRLSPEVLINGNDLLNLDNLIDFIHAQRINVVFGCEIFDDADDYLITEEVIEEELGKYSAEELKSIIANDIKEYNERVYEIDFDIPSLYIVACLYQGQYFYTKNRINRGGDEKFLIDPNEKLQEIVVDNERKIQEKREERRNTLEELKRELKEIIIKDDKFLKCTNARLRVNYIRELLANELDEHFEPLRKFWMSETSRGIYQEAIDLIELIWRELKG